jgi:hypothetical protein
MTKTLLHTNTTPGDKITLILQDVIITASIVSIKSRESSPTPMPDDYAAATLTVTPTNVMRRRDG